MKMMIRSYHINRLISDPFSQYFDISALPSSPAWKVSDTSSQAELRLFFSFFLQTTNMMI